MKQEKVYLYCDHMELKLKLMYYIEDSREKASSEETV